MIFFISIKHLWLSYIITHRSRKVNMIVFGDILKRGNKRAP
jgi:hypothetical protein